MAYRVTKDTPSPNRPRNWKTDPDIPAGETLDDADYKLAHETLKTDRGHQANLASVAGVNYTERYADRRLGLLEKT